MLTPGKANAYYTKATQIPLEQIIRERLATSVPNPRDVAIFMFGNTRKQVASRLQINSSTVARSTARLFKRHKVNTFVDVLPSLKEGDSSNRV